MTIICMQVKRCHFPGFTVKNAGGLMWFSMNKNRKKNSRNYRDFNIVLGWPCECHLNRFFKKWKGSMSKFSLLRCDLCIHANTVTNTWHESIKKRCCRLIALYM